MDTGHSPEERQEEYSFMQETFKDEKIGPKKIIAKSFKWIAFGILFGAAACTTFFALKPWAEETFQEEPEQVEIHHEEEQPDVDEPEEQEPVQVEIPKEEDEQPEEQTEDHQLTINDYFILNNELKQVAAEAQKSVVMISGLSEEADWMGGPSRNLGNTSGLIVADNGRELLLLTKYSTLKEAKIFQVQFVDDSRHQASLKQKDANLDLAVFSVPKDGLSEETWGKIGIAKIGYSKNFAQGRTVIAVGQPFGIEDGVGYGINSAVGQKVTHADGEYEVIVTDMTYVASGNGFLFDLYGNVIGIIAPNALGASNTGVMTAYGISDITNVIEMMSNGKYIPYAGIVGTMVTEETSELYGIPQGLYVSEVELDSPAMNAGIQNGDIITHISDTEIASLEVYHNTLYALEAGSSIKFMGQRYGTEEYVDIDFTVTIGIKE